MNFEFIQYIGICLSVLIGISLGLMGSGGSILTVPVLIYLIGLDAVVATSYSLFIVGVTALVGSLKGFLAKLIDVKIATFFAIPSMLAVFLTRKFLLAAIPDVLFANSNFELTKRMLIMGIFVLLMIGSAIKMIRSKQLTTEKNISLWFIALEGLVVGVLTGLVGAGGGFLIIPALVLIAKVPMEKAVYTSLIIIAVKSLTGFAGDYGNIQINWMLLSIITSVTVTGIFIGGYISKYVCGPCLKKVFGYFLLVMSALIIVKELTL